MIRKTLTWTVAATAAVLLGLSGLSGPAGADPHFPITTATVTQPTPVKSTTASWIPAPCATGSFDPAALEQGHYLVPVHMTLCTGYPAKFAYALLLYTPDWDFPVTSRNRLIPYAATGSSDVIADVQLPSPEPVFGLCLLRDINTRVACTRIDTTAGTVTSAPIPVGDPLVAKQAFYDEADIPSPPDPYCGTCVSFRDASR